MNQGPKPISKARSTWTRETDLDIGGVEAHVFTRRVGDGMLAAIIGEEPTGWHMSISFRDNRGNLSRYPRWDEISDARYALCPDDIDMVMHLPPPAEYVAVHDTTFHLHEHPER